MEQTIGQPVGQTGILRTLNIKKMIKRFCPGNPGAGLVP